MTKIKNYEEIRNEKGIQELLEFSILNIDKPSGPTSFDISDFVRKKLKEFGIRKTSHFGTLDPKVTGVLPIALNRACKLTGYFLGHDKEYIGIMRFHEEMDLDKIKKIINEKFLGKIKQTPPVKSRVKRVEREREIKRFEIIEESANRKDFLFIAEVQGGTYIRKLIDDLGKELGGGAHMLELRRIRAGIFKEDTENFLFSVPQTSGKQEVRGENKLVNLYEFEKAVDVFLKGDERLLREILIPAEEVLKKIFPVVEIRKDNLKQIYTGKPIHNNDLKEKVCNIEEGRLVCIFSDNQFIGIYKIINEERIFAKPEFVLQPLK